MSVSYVIPTIVSKDISDHSPTFAEFISKQFKKFAKRPYARKLLRENIDLFLAYLNTLIYNLERNKNHTLEKLIKKMLDSTNQYLPQKILNRKQYQISKNP